MVRWHHQLNGCEFAQTQGDSEGQGSPVCCSPWGLKDINIYIHICISMCKWCAYLDMHILTCTGISQHITENTSTHS